MSEVTNAAALDSDLVPSGASGNQPDDTERKSKTGRRILTIILILLALLLAVIGYFLFRLMVPAGAPSRADLGEMGWIRSIYGFGQEKEQLTKPSGIALDPSDGNIWLADPVAFRIVEYNTDGSFASVIAPSDEASTSAQARLRHPADVAMDRDGLLYVVEPTYDVVRVFQRDGTELGQFGVPEPLSVAVNDDFIVVGAESGVAVLDKSGNPITLIGTNGRGEGEFDKVNGVAIDEDNVVYAADTFNNRLSAWSSQGENLWTVETGHPGNRQMTGEMTFETTAAAQMQLPMGMTIDGNDRLVVADMYDFSLVAFDKSDGTFLGKYGALGVEDGKFVYPSDVDYDPVHDWFVVSDTGAQRAQIITLPDSGGSLLASARNRLSGPLGACLFPLLLLLLIILIAVVNRYLRRRREEMRARQQAEVVLSDGA